MNIMDIHKPPKNSIETTTIRKIAPQYPSARSTTSAYVVAFLHCAVSKQLTSIFPEKFARHVKKARITIETHPPFATAYGFERSPNPTYIHRIVQQADLILNFPVGFNGG